MHPVAKISTSKNKGNDFTGRIGADDPTMIIDAMLNRVLLGTGEESAKNNCVEKRFHLVSPKMSFDGAQDDILGKTWK